MGELTGHRINVPAGAAGQLVIDRVFQHFRESSAWPEFDLIDRTLYAEGVSSEEAFEQLPEGLLIGPDRNRWNHLPSPETPLELTLMGAINCSGDSALPEVEGAVLLTRLAAEADRHWKPTSERRDPFLRKGRAINILKESGLPWPKSMSYFVDSNFPFAGLSFLGPDAEKRNAARREGRFDLMLRAAKLLTREPQFKGAGFSEEFGWELRFDRAIRPFAGVETITDYWRRRCDLVLNLGVAGMIAAVVTEPDRDEREVDSPACSEDASRWSVECSLHDGIVEAVADRYASGHLADAVQKAFQAVEYRVQGLLDSSEVGAKLMGSAFGGVTPRLMVVRADGASQVSEQDGFRDLYRGAMSGLRNPRAHGPHYAEEEAEVLEILAFASLLMRRLDLAEQRLRSATEADGSTE
ncbi:TIGR02391 family protein [Streptomyces sp. NPDC005775]|uniref:TIGR02391 family protein n=1 Tax=unclassified Streptomyces TaxID=2593676 RepID=UPI0033C54C87